MKKQLTLNIDGKLYDSNYTKIGSKFIVDTHHPDFNGIFQDTFTYRINHGKPNFLVFHSKTEEIGKQIISQVFMNEVERD
jgi:hypothetical protein